MSICLMCERHMIGATQWRSSSKAEREAWGADGVRQGASRGLCRPCWFRAKRAGTLDDYSLPEAPEFCTAPECDRKFHARGLCTMHLRRLTVHGSLDLPTEEDRFWEKVQKGDGCWHWLGATLGGYGRARFGGEVRPAHRVAHELCIGPIPEGFEVDHVRARGCDSTGCVNPAHLEAVPPRINKYRGDGWSGRNHRATHCPKGHEYDAENTYYRRDRWGRDCRACRSSRVRGGDG